MKVDFFRHDLSRQSHFSATVWPKSTNLFLKKILWVREQVIKISFHLVQFYRSYSETKSTFCPPCTIAKEEVTQQTISSHTTRTFASDQPESLRTHWSSCSLNLTRFGAAILTKIDETKKKSHFFRNAFHENRRCSAVPKPISTKLYPHVA